jgi:inosose dehydratase
MTLQLAFSRPTSTDQERNVLFQQYRRIGYDGLQLKHAQYAPFIDSPGAFLEQWGEHCGIASALITGGKLDEQNQEQLRSLLGFANKAGTELIVFCHLVPRKGIEAEDIRRYARVLSELGKEAQQAGVTLSLHHHHDQPVMYRDDFDIFYDEVKDGSVGLTIDTAHLVKSGITDIQEVIRSFHPYIHNFHLKDFSDGEWKVLGHGDIPFDPIFQAIRDTRYNGWISADEESGSGIVEGMRDCLQFMRSGLAMNDS